MCLIMIAGCEKIFSRIVVDYSICAETKNKTSSQKYHPALEECFNHPNPNYAYESVKPMQFFFPPPSSQKK